MYFKNIIGQKNIIKQLNLLFENNQVPHSQIFIDRFNSGGLSIALDYSLLLLNNQHKTDLNQKSEIKRYYFEHPDLSFIFPLPSPKNTISEYLSPWFEFLNSKKYHPVEDWLNHIESGNKQGIISVEIIKELNKSLRLKSFSGGKKICVIWGAEKLNELASNKLLKLIEEPPPLTYFLIISNNEKKLLPTLKSRCQVIRIPPTKNEDIKSYYTKVGIENNKQAYLINASMGSSSMAIKLSEDEKNTIKLEEMLIKCLRLSFSAQKTKDSFVNLMIWADDIGAWSRQLQLSFLQFASSFIRDSMLISYGSGEIISYHSKLNFNIKNFAPFIHSNNVEEIFNLIDSSYSLIERNANGKILFTDFSLKMMNYLKIKEIN